VETGIFMLKRHQGAALKARTEATRRSEMALMAVTHNMLIVHTQELFYKAGRESFPGVSRAHNSPASVPGDMSSINDARPDT
jgi:hypothetical protein